VESGSESGLLRRVAWHDLWMDFACGLQAVKRSSLHTSAFFFGIARFISRPPSHRAISRVCSAFRGKRNAASLRNNSGSALAGETGSKVNRNPLIAGGFFNCRGKLPAN